MGPLLSAEPGYLHPQPAALYSIFLSFVDLEAFSLFLPPHWEINPGIPAGTAGVSEMLVILLPSPLINLISVGFFRSKVFETMLSGFCFWFEKVSTIPKPDEAMGVLKKNKTKKLFPTLYDSPGYVLYFYLIFPPLRMKIEFWCLSGGSTAAVSRAACLLC